MPFTATGGSAQDITVDGVNYRAHTFTSDQNFVVSEGGEVEYLIVAGGGGGGLDLGGGGGGGGVRTGTVTLAPGTYSVVIGQGGSGSTSQSNTGSKGDNSSFNNIIALGGGGGKSRNSGTGNSEGGSGGGGSFNNTTAGLGTAGQGFSGGTAATYGCGGGGGGGGTGDNATAPAQGGNGGIGYLSSISGVATYYAAGGGGGGGTSLGTPSGAGAGGLGGGGAGSTAGGVTPTNGTANTGGGGGGQGGTSGVGPSGSGGSGGSGIVILRYYGSNPLSSNTVVSTKFINKFEPVEPFTPVQALFGTAPFSYSISPALPTGMSINSSTGTISGIPTERIAPTTYTVSITDATNTTVSSTFLLETTVSYLGAIDLVTNSILSIEVVEAISDSDRLLGDITPTDITVVVNNQASGTIETSPELALTITSLYDFYKGSYKSYYGSLSVDVGTYTLNQQLFDTPGTYTWTVPSGVTSITAGAIGGGGAGAQNSLGGSGGGGAFLDYVNALTVTPGQQLTVTVGAGGTTGSDFGNNGDPSYLTLPGTNMTTIFAGGGRGGDSLYWSEPNISYSGYDVTGIFTTQTAIDPKSRTITYSISSGSLPTGFTLNTSTGDISYTAQGVSQDTELTPFTISASVSGQTISKQLILKVRQIPGGSSSDPVASATELRSYGVTSDGAYWFSTAKQPTPFQAYVKFNYIDGGDWYLLMKVHNQGDMPSGSAFWTNTTLNNETDWNLTSGNWSKYATWNGVEFTKLMMVMTQGGVAKVPPIMNFNTSRTFAEAITAAGGTSAASAANNTVRADSTDPVIATNATYWNMTMKSGTNFTDAGGLEDYIQAYGIAMWGNNASNSTTAEGFSSTGRSGAWIGCPLDDAGHTFNNVTNAGSDSGFGIGTAAGNPAKTTSAGYAEWTNSASTNTLPAYVWVR
jgi:hypothetical protein